MHRTDNPQIITLQNADIVSMDFVRVTMPEIRILKSKVDRSPDRQAPAHDTQSNDVLVRMHNYVYVWNVWTEKCNNQTSCPADRQRVAVDLDGYRSAPNLLRVVDVIAVRQLSPMSCFRGSASDTWPHQPRKRAWASASVVPSPPRKRSANAWR